MSMQIDKINTSDNIASIMVNGSEYCNSTIDIDTLNMIYQKDNYCIEMIDDCNLRLSFIMKGVKHSYDFFKKYDDNKFHIPFVNEVLSEFVM
jgi:hypothetical protein